MKYHLDWLIEEYNQEETLKVYLLTDVTQHY